MKTARVRFNFYHKSTIICKYSKSCSSVHYLSCSFLILPISFYTPPPAPPPSAILFPSPLIVLLFFLTYFLLSSLLTLYLLLFFLSYLFLLFFLSYLLLFLLPYLLHLFSLFILASKLGKSEPFAVCHLRLMKNDDTAIADGLHELYVYNVRELIIINKH